MDTEMLQWKCSCGATAPATTSHYMSFIAQKAHRGHKVTLVNKDSGEIVALNIKTAEDAGIVLPKGKVKPSKKAAPPPKEETSLEGPPVAPPAAPKEEPKAIPEKEEMGEREETPETEEAILESKGAVGDEDEDEDEDEDKEAMREGGEVSRARIRNVTTAGDFTYEITLPADAFMLFNLAKACGLEKNDDLLFDVWVWECIKARYAKDYKLELVLSPVEES